MNDSVVTPQKCPRCGAILPADAPEGLCPRCLGALHVAPETAFTGAEAVSAQAPLSTEELAPHFPQLEILECLGRGGMGVVYRARQKSLNRIVALKLLAPERVRDGKFAERFTHEAHALAALNHPHIVTVYDFGEAGGFYYLLMEFVDGVNLRQAMKAGRFTPEQALAIVPPVCEALQYAHDHGIVHRDIKPENLLLDKEGRVKIADFGIAKLIGEQTDQSHTSHASHRSHSSSVTLGTPTYMAPEQRDTPAEVDHRADIYSLGVVLYELLTGELPAEKLRPPSEHPGGIRIDVRLDEVVLRALEKAPELRYQTAADFRTEVQTIAATAIHSSEGRDAKGRNSTIWIGGAVASLLALIALVLNVPAMSRIREWAASKNKRVEGVSSVKPAPKPTVQTQPPEDDPARRDAAVSSETLVAPRSSAIASQEPGPVKTDTRESTPPAEQEITRPPPASASATPVTTQALHHEALLIQLRQATEAARLREAEYRAGTGDYSALLAAKEKRDLLQARIDGAAARMTSIRIEAARQQAALVEARYRSGEADQSEVLAAKEKVDVLEAETHGDAVEVAKVRLAAAEGQLGIAEARSRVGDLPFLDLEAARNAVELRRAELREAKAAKAAKRIQK